MKAHHKNCRTCTKKCKITVIDADNGKLVSFNPKDPIEETLWFTQGIKQVGCATWSDEEPQEKPLCPYEENCARSTYSTCMYCDQRYDQEYILTEKQVQWWESGKPFSKEERTEMCNSIRSRKYNPQAERERLIKELWDWTDGDDNELDRPAKYKGDHVHASGRLRKKLLELREGKDGE